jgi:L-threonylcarbamoyladenylate synthase
VLDAVTGGAADTIAVRVPAHPVAQSLLAAFGNRVPAGQPVGVAAPSANRYGKVSPTTAQHVAADLGADVDLILDGGPCEVGIESTIVDVSGQHVSILRPGRITAAEIERVLDSPLSPPANERPKAPGSHASHYAPRAKVQLASRRQIIDTLASNRGRRIAVLALEVSVPRLSPALTAVVPVIPAQYARSLYASLRALDAAGADVILVETPPDTPAWAGVLDRLRRAAVR